MIGKVNPEEAKRLARLHIDNEVEDGYPDCKVCGCTMEPAQFDDEKAVWCSSCAYKVLDVLAAYVVSLEACAE